ncbi:hypothetical protein CMI37_39520 [Candidatus Pacearchaeota archaeon]|nr:hypothetical protein [Candidatus Pacearchaeota archaeon]|tara:strand:+ start:610 stop:849 length:240 start_codon:yes stop_codon:yes gene_type:complete
MNLTKSQLKQIIQEELISVLQEEEGHTCYEDLKDPGKVFWFYREKTKIYCSGTSCRPTRAKPGEAKNAATLYKTVSCPE